MEFSSLALETNRSSLNHYLRFDYQSLADFGDFINKVNIEARLHKSRLNSKDIEFFAPAMTAAQFDVLLDGHLSGKVKAIKGRNFSIQTGRTTHLNGNFSIVGLPHIERAIFDLDLHQLATTAEDVDELVPRLSNERHFKLPGLLSRLGHVHYSGRITGTYHDFLTKGHFKTALGMLSTDVYLELNGNKKYSGQIEGTDFNLGSLLNERRLGMSSFSVMISGEGFNPIDWTTKFGGDIQSIDYNGYAYRHIQLQGSYINKLLAGDLQIVDPNLRMKLTGSLDLKAGLPGGDRFIPGGSFGNGRQPVCPHTIRYHGGTDTWGNGFIYIPVLF